MEKVSRLCVVSAIAIALFGCTTSDNGVRVSTEKTPVATAPVQKARDEPIFYNGKNYRLKFQPLAGGNYKMAVGGMSSQQQKDAVAVATSSLRYFACPDGKTGKLTDQPKYVDSAWTMSARCG
jgi:hypothetical protein